MLKVNVVLDYPEDMVADLTVHAESVEHAVAAVKARIPPCRRKHAAVLATNEVHDLLDAVKESGEDA